MTLATFVLVLIFALCLYFLLSPLLLAGEHASSSDSPNSARDLQYRKDEVLESLKEFDLDLKMNKISDKDYQSLYQEAFTEGTKILKEIDQQRVVPAAATSKGPAQSVKSSKFCIHCGESVLQGARFCGQCGTKIA